MSLRIHCLQHVSFEGVGHIEVWAKKNNHTLSFTRFFEDGNLPSQDDFDWLVVMGGSMNIFDDSLGWLNEEKMFVKETIDAGKVVVGICLGAQLIAHVLGANVYANNHKEIGWWPVVVTEGLGESHELLKDFPDEFVTFHWHGDTFDTPKGAVNLLSSEVTANQAFLYDNRVLALQFHFETTPHSLEEITSNCRDELFDAPFIQSEKVILEEGVRYISDNNKRLEMILDRLANRDL